jgi:hypothetical protein
MTPIQKNFLADLCGIGSEAADPKAVTNDGNVLPIVTIVLRSEISTEGRLDTENTEVRGGNWQSAQMLGSGSDGKVVAD